MKKSVLLALCASVSACVSATPAAPLKTTTLNMAQIDAMHTVVLSKLRDPGSVQWGENKAGIDAKGKTFVCGTVNAKNGFGGYTGMTPYMGEFDGGQFKLGGIGGVPEVTTAIYQVCAQQGLGLS